MSNTAFDSDWVSWPSMGVLPGYLWDTRCLATLLDIVEWFLRIGLLNASLVFRRDSDTTWIPSLSG